MMCRKHSSFHRPDRHTSYTEGSRPRGVLTGSQTANPGALNSLVVDAVRWLANIFVRLLPDGCPSIQSWCFHYDIDNHQPSLTRSGPFDSDSLYAVECPASTLLSFLLHPRYEICLHFAIYGPPTQVNNWKQMIEWRSKPSEYEHPACRGGIRPGITYDYAKYLGSDQAHAKALEASSCHRQNRGRGRVIRGTVLTTG
jgi:hypothetical protein